ncbi:tetratricopeptide repeat protein (plasmid) [Paroceanicella profunda]|uniref:Tetratricopeptide repeat protein n=1 Tax=Paroceanicella profunda TaxID=2579971 RepID=A0A5B8FJD7_9RHOB|nr:sulfotransferase [Paroceanicella profunda]QDL94771.1 tetratricopeptide repeat protein [Paroceanicella profunda]
MRVIQQKKPKVKAQPVSKKHRYGVRHFEEGVKHMGRGQYAEAVACFERALKKDPRNSGLLFYLGASLCNMDETARGLRILRESLSLKPDEPSRWWNYANFLYFAGELEEASRMMLRAIDMQPEKINPMYNYCTMSNAGPDDPIVHRLHGLIEKGGLNRVERSFAHYGLAKVYDRAKAYDKAFDHALLGGEAYGVECNLDSENVERIIRANTREALTRQPCGGDPSEAPVFVLGMPRSGTTFTETVLSRHPDILAAGELSGCRTAEILAMNWASQNTRITNAFESVRTIVPQVEEVAAQYLMSQVHGFAPGQTFRRFIDKLPENVFRLGLISRMFPNARVIVIHRHPLDNCVSCLFQRFNDVQYSYTNTIEALAGQYRAYQRVMAHWREVLPLRMHEIVYEDMVTDFEPHVRELIAFLELDWDPACLDPASSTRTVRTASAAQVREGVNNRSVDKWKRYGTRLDPLIEALGGMEQIEAWARPRL